MTQIIRHQCRLLDQSLSRHTHLPLAALLAAQHRHGGGPLGTSAPPHLTSALPYPPCRCQSTLHTCVPLFFTSPCTLPELPLPKPAWPHHVPVPMNLHLPATLPMCRFGHHRYMLITQLERPAAASTALLGPNAESITPACMFMPATS